MKSKVKLFALVAVLAAASGSLFAQSATGDATANILQGLGVINAAGDAGDLDWGDIMPGTVQSVVNITSDAAGTRSLSSGDAVLVASDAGNSALFSATGSAGSTVDLSLTSASITLDDGGVNTMDATISLSAASALLVGGTADFYVGGDLTVGVGQAAGAYSTTFEVNVQYQ